MRNEGMVVPCEGQEPGLERVVKMLVNIAEESKSLVAELESTLADRTRADKMPPSGAECGPQVAKHPIKTLQYALEGLAEGLIANNQRLESILRRTQEAVGQFKVYED